jgi:hypothetical protein
MNTATLRKRCQARLADLDLPRPFDVRALCANLERLRGKPIVLVPLELSATGPCGLWISDDRRDYIVHESATSPMHQEHIILHEIGHLLCDHQGAAKLTGEHAAGLFRTLDPAMVRKVLGRSGYTSEEEAEAEMLASLILQRADRTPLATPPADPADAAVVRRLESGM